MGLRKNDAPGKAIFRSERVFCSNGQWFIQVREGQLGPFDSRHDAAVELGFYLRDQGVMPQQADSLAYAQCFADALRQLDSKALR